LKIKPLDYKANPPCKEKGFQSSGPLSYCILGQMTAWYRLWRLHPDNLTLRLLPTMKQFAGMFLASVWMATCPGCKPAPELEVTASPPKVTIPDNSKRGMQLAIVSVRWSDGAAFTGDVRLTKNPGGICQLSRIAERGNSLTGATRMELQLGRDTTKADDNTIPVCTVTAFKEGDGH
jgi:hypothetical protein